MLQIFSKVLDVIHSKLRPYRVAVGQDKGGRKIGIIIQELVSFLQLIKQL